MTQNKLRKIPAVGDLLELIDQQPWASEYSREQKVRAARREIADVRLLLQNTDQSLPEIQDLLAGVKKRLEDLHHFSLKRVINATGIIVHTNLGRAPLSAEAFAHLKEIASGYSNLEFDLETGKRGSREIHVEKLLTNLLPVEAALIVNNNAAALLLILNTLADRKEVLVSRGELVEIGGSFRLPEIMKKSGALLKEVGTTNKTKLEDYRIALNENTGMILVVHPSNFQIVGFTEKPGLQEIVQLGKQYNLPVVEDHGSGILIDLGNYGIPAEPSVAGRLAEGVDLICFSGDKILGGPQAGIVVGKKSLVERLRKNPLFRALRVDKMVYAVMEATLIAYLQGKSEKIPVVRMLSWTEEELKKRAELWIADLKRKFPKENWIIQATTNYLGGGVAPMKALASCAVSLKPSTDDVNFIAQRLRLAQPSILARIEEDRILFELRTLSESEQTEILSMLETILEARKDGIHGNRGEK